MKKSKGRMIGVLSICPVDDNVLSLDPHKNGKHVEILNKPVISVVKGVNLVYISLFLNNVTRDKYYNIEFEKGTTLVKSIMSIVGVSKVTAESIYKDLLNAQILHKVNTRHYIINPFLFKFSDVSVFKTFEAQLRWEYFFFEDHKDVLPFYNYITEVTSSQEEYDNEMKKITKEVNVNNAI